MLAGDERTRVDHLQRTRRIPPRPSRFDTSRRGIRQHAADSSPAQRASGLWSRWPIPALELDSETPLASRDSAASSDGSYDWAGREYRQDRTRRGRTDWLDDRVIGDRAATAAGNLGDELGELRVRDAAVHGPRDAARPVERDAQRGGRVGHATGFALNHQRGRAGGRARDLVADARDVDQGRQLGEGVPALAVGIALDASCIRVTATMGDAIAIAVPRSRV